MFFWPQTVENRAALRTAISAVIAVLISFAFHLQTPYWSGMTVVIVANLYTGSIIDKAMMRIIGTVAGAFLGFFVAGLVVNSFLLYLLSCFIIVSIAVYYYTLSSYGYAYLLGALCAFIVISQSAIDPNNVFFVAIWRSVEIAIGVLVSAIGAYVFFPNHLKDNILQQVNDIFNDFSQEFEQLAQGLQQEDLVFETLAQNNLQIKKKLRKAIELIGALNRELGVTKEKTDILRAFLDSFYDLSRQLGYLIITQPTAKALKAMHSLPVEEVFTAIASDLNLLKSAFTRQSRVTNALQTGSALKILEKKLALKRNKNLKSDFVFSLLHFLEQSEKSFQLMHSLLAGDVVKDNSGITIIRKQDRLRSDNDLIKQGIKAGLAVLLALGFWMVSGWPGGLNGIISSLVISIRKNLFEMKNVSVHRIIGCFLGGGIALISLFVFELNLYDLICVLFLSIWGFSYFMFKWPKYAYLGLQANIALIISLAQEGGPPVLLDPPLQRLGGILIGITASFIVANILWRSDVLTILGRYLKKLYAFITFNMEQVFLRQNKPVQLQDLANLFWISRGIIESLADEQLSIKKQNKLQVLREKFESLVIIQATLSHILVAVDRVKALHTAQLFDFDLARTEADLVLFYKQHDKESGLNLSQQLVGFLSSVEKKAAYKTVKGSELRNFLAYINALNHLALRVG